MKRNSNYFAQQAESLIFQDCFHLWIAYFMKWEKKVSEHYLTFLDPMFAKNIMLKPCVSGKLTQKA